ncbi:ASPIC/UnbV domain-containing protein, partial [bacterium]|nr:ASPIC/UnbV domain-containing protein [bacterium]
SSYADIDNDGDLDVVIATTGQKPRLLRNDLNSSHHWVRVKLKNDPAQVIGALVELTANGKVSRRRVSPTKSYLSQSELPLTFGLDEYSLVDKIRVVWTDGTESVIKDHPVDQMITVDAQSE